MKSSAFTLIELLVVVLIVGILSAIALPQYEKAVEKSRAMEGIVLARAVLDAQQRYYLANGTYSKDLNELDIQIPGQAIAAKGHALSVQSAKYFDCSAASTGTDESLIVFCLRKNFSYFIAARKSTKKLHCGWGSGSPDGAKWCKLLTGKTENGAEF